MTVRLRISWLLVLLLWTLLSQAQDTITLNPVNVTAEGVQKEELRLRVQPTGKEDLLLVASGE